MLKIEKQYDIMVYDDLSVLNMMERGFVLWLVF